jgi:hypothetical protein
MTEHIEKIQTLISGFSKETLEILDRITTTQQFKKERFYCIRMKYAEKAI